jgi:BMFP domain-containing protein YqiC
MDIKEFDALKKKLFEKRSELAALQAQVNDLEKQVKEAKEDLLQRIEAEPK